MKFRRLLQIVVALLLTSLPACEEMPELLNEDVIQDPRLVAGPYVVVGSTQEDEFAYLRSNISAIPGIKLIGGKNDTVRRYGRSARNHEINLTPLLDSSLPVQKFELLLDDVKSSIITIKNPPVDEQSVIGFLGGGKGRIDLLGKAAQTLRAYSPDATVLTGGSFPLDEKISTWDKDFFSPLKVLTPSSPLMFIPEDRAILPVNAGRGDGAAFWSRDLGSVHLSFISLDTLKTPADRTVTLQWLRDDLAGTICKWRVLVISEPLFAAQRIYARAIETLGTLLESGGVDLVVSGGGKYYQRTLPIKSAGSKPVRYIVTGGVSTGYSLPVGREYRAAAANRPHVAVLSATDNSLQWQVISLQGAEVLDRLTLLEDGSSLSGEPAIEKMDILTDALSALNLQREVVTIASQAAKAVENPQQQQEISFVLENASPEDIKGQLIWEIPYDSAYDIEPQAMKFGLESGFQGKVKFKVRPLVSGIDPTLPVLKVSLTGVGSASQPLIISKLKQGEIVRFAPDEIITIDGAMQEEGWQKIKPFTDFTVLSTAKKPKQPFEARVGYDSSGIYIIARAAAQNPGEILTSAKMHDDPVHKDESIEFFIDPDNNGRDYFQFAVNTQGITLDRSNKNGLAWNPRWDVEVKKFSTFYTVEAFIPYQALGVSSMPSEGEEWGFNICRNDYQQSAVRENPFAVKKVDEVLEGKTRVSRLNIGALAEEELGETVVEEDEEIIEGPGFEVVQWADTYGDNARSGLYGKVRFVKE